MGPSCPWILESCAARNSPETGGPISGIPGSRIGGALADRVLSRQLLWIGADGTGGGARRISLTLGHTCGAFFGGGAIGGLA